MDIENAELVNGQLDENLEKIRQLETLFGTHRSGFGTHDPRIFAEKLDNMSYAQMQKMALRVGVNCYTDKPRLRKALEKAFAAHKVAPFEELPKPIPSAVLDPKDPEQRLLMKRLGMDT